MKLIEVTPENAQSESFFCIKDRKRDGFKDKYRWFEARRREGLKLKILKSTEGKMIGFIEYVPGQYAWRPIDAENYMFIHCIYIYAKKHRCKGYGRVLIEDAEGEARSLGMDGLCTMTSEGGWLANKQLFENNGFVESEAKDRFQLMVKRWNKNAAAPRLIDWHSRQKAYSGWQLTYADQCPWHEKSVTAILNVAMDHGIEIKVTKINSAAEAREAPSGFGVFNLLRDGRLLEDHYISHTRFRNILKKELG